MPPEAGASGPPQRLRLILHAGFHKTGTTTVQNCLRENQTLLSPHLRVFLRTDMVSLCEAARKWSASRAPTDFAVLQLECAEFIEALDPNDQRPVLLASEDLSGHMPGRHGLKDYGAAPHLMKCIQDTALEFHPDACVRILFTTRSEQAWLQSCYVQHLRASPMTLEADEYAKQYAPSADLQRIVSLTQEAASRSEVFTTALEAASSHRLGPFSALLPHLSLPAATADAVTPAPPANTRPDQDVLEQLLALNRSRQPYRQIHQKKQDLLRALRRSKRAPG